MSKAPRRPRSPQVNPEQTRHTPEKKGVGGVVKEQEAMVLFLSEGIQKLDELEPRDPDMTIQYELDIATLRDAQTILGIGDDPSAEITVLPNVSREQVALALHGVAVGEGGGAYRTVLSTGSTFSHYDLSRPMGLAETLRSLEDSASEELAAR